MVEETVEPGMTVSLVARRHGVAPTPAVPVAPPGGARRANNRHGLHGELLRHGHAETRCDLECGA
jgi:hypothetical protein